MKLQKARFQMGTVIGISLGVGSLIVSIIMVQSQGNTCAIGWLSR